MAIFFGGEKVEAVLFSPLEGQLTLHGKPAAGAKLTLWLTWKDPEGEYFSYVTDDDGKFFVPEHKATYKQSVLAQLVVSQKITVEYEGSEYIIWNMSKQERDAYTELGGKPVNVRCELTNELTTIRGVGSLGGVACVWDAME